MGLKLKETYEPQHTMSAQFCPTPERLDKLFGKLDLSGAHAWTDQERQENQRSSDRIP